MPSSDGRAKQQQQKQMGAARADASHRRGVVGCIMDESSTDGSLVDLAALCYSTAQPRAGGVTCMTLASANLVAGAESWK